LLRTLWKRDGKTPKTNPSPPKSSWSSAHFHSIPPDDTLLSHGLKAWLWIKSCTPHPHGRPTHLEVFFSSKIRSHGLPESTRSSGAARKCARPIPWNEPISSRNPKRLGTHG
jgi:hypothetical protein